MVYSHSSRCYMTFMSCLGNVVHKYGLFFSPHGFSRSKSNWQSKKGKTFIIGMLKSPKARSVKNKRIDIVHKMYYSNVAPYLATFSKFTVSNFILCFCSSCYQSTTRKVKRDRIQLPKPSLCRAICRDHAQMNSAAKWFLLPVGLISALFSHESQANWILRHLLSALSRIVIFVLLHATKGFGRTHENETNEQKVVKSSFTDAWQALSHEAVVAFL